MAKVALKFLMVASALRRRKRRTDWVWLLAISSALVTIGLVALYLLQRGAIG
jgi:hypothetical protein